MAPCDLVRRWGEDSDASALATLAERLHVEIVPSEHALLLSVRDIDREDAADLANAIGNRFVARKDSEVRAEANARVRRLGLERDAAARGIVSGDVVRVFTERGACLAVAALSDVVARGIVQMPTGSWYAPAIIDGRMTCLAGNPNAVTADRGSSTLAQGSTGQHVLVGR